MSEGRVAITTSTLYGAIKRLLDRGWIIQVEDPEPTETDWERKAYALTELGRWLLFAEVERMRKLVMVTQTRKAGET